MKRTALALVMMAGGCNWAFGITDTRLIDAGGPGIDAPDAMTIRSSLAWAIPNSDGIGTAEPLMYAAIGSEPARPEVPIIMVGPALGQGPLQPAPYLVGEAGGLVGVFDVPQELESVPHRIVYTVPGDPVPMEVQTTIGGVRLTVPRLTRLNAPAPPSGDTGYRMTPVNLPPGGTDYAYHYTHGAFTFIGHNDGTAPEPYTFTDSFSTITVHWGQFATPMLGPLGSPEPSKGDWQLHATWANPSVFDYLIDGFALTRSALMANGPTVASPQPTWHGATSEGVVRGPANPTRPLPTNQYSTARPRMMNALGGLAIDNGIVDPGIQIPKFQIMYGVTPSSQLPGFVHDRIGRSPNYLGDGSVLPRSLLIPFWLSSSYAATATEPFMDPTEIYDLGLQRAVDATIISWRDTNGVRLYSGMATTTTTLTGQLRWEATFATTIKLGATDLSGPNDSVMHAPSTSPVKLTWATETNFGADDYVVTLFLISGNAMTAVRRYQVTGPSVDVDSALLETGKTYAFQIIARKGWPGAVTGDWSVASMPFSHTTTFPRTFTIGP